MGGQGEPVPPSLRSRPAQHAGRLEAHVRCTALATALPSTAVSLATAAMSLTTPTIAGTASAVATPVEPSAALSGARAATATVARTTHAATDALRAILGPLWSRGGLHSLQP